jgi:hypothetical protein
MDEQKIGWTVSENDSSVKLDLDRLYDVDEAREFYTHHAVWVTDEMKKRYGSVWANIPILEFLNGKQWNNCALNYAMAFSPRAIRVTKGECTCDEMTGRITVIVDENNTIQRISMEAAPGGIGIRFGADLIEHLPGAARLPDMPEGCGYSIVNPRALKRMMEELDQEKK